MHEDEVAIEGKDLGYVWILIIKSRSEPKSHRDSDFNSLHIRIPGFMVLPVIKHGLQNGTAAQKYTYLVKIRGVRAWKTAPDSSLIEITLYKKHRVQISGYVLLLGRKVLEKGQIPANLSMGREEWVVARGWGNCKFRARENIIMAKAVQAMGLGSLWRRCCWRLGQTRAMSGRALSPQCSKATSPAQPRALPEPCLDARSLHLCEAVHVQKSAEFTPGEKNGARVPLIGSMAAFRNTSVLLIT